MIRYLLYKNKSNSIITIILKCPDCGTWGHLILRDRRKLLVSHKTKTGHTEHRLHGALFDYMMPVFLKCRGSRRDEIKPFFSQLTDNYIYNKNNVVVEAGR